MDKKNGYRDSFVKRIVFAGLIVLCLPVQASDPVDFVRLVENRAGAAPVLDLSDVDDQERDISDFRGRVTLVHFWATWCSPCLKELPDLKSFSEKFSNSDVHVVAVAVDSHELVREFVANRNMGIDIVVDQYGSAMRDYKVTALPSSYIIDKNGELQFLAVGPVDWLSDETSRLIENLVGTAEENHEKI